jgi:hypothetical protein
MQQAITLEDANRIADEYIEKGLEALSPQAELTNPSNDDKFPCATPLTAPAETFSAARDYQVVGLPSDDPDVYYQKLREWWPTRGFRITHDNTAGADLTSLTAENAQNNFTMTLEHNDLGEFYLSVSSPCVRADGTPTPPTS